MGKVKTRKPPKTALIDKKVIAQFDELYLEGEPDILVELIESFLNTTPQQIHQMEQSMELGDFAAVSKQAHSLKSAALSLGASLLGQCCQQLEHCPNLGHQQTMPALLEQLKELYLSSSQELTEIKAAQQTKYRSKKNAA